MTIFRLYADNGHRAGFWVQHRTWPNACVQVLSIAGQSNGALTGAAAEAAAANVLIRGYDVRSGRPVDLGQRLDLPQDRHYTRIAEPSWYHDPRHASHERSRAKFC